LEKTKVELLEEELMAKKAAVPAAQQVLVLRFDMLGTIRRLARYAG
jgi:hypothetical protein